MSDPIVLLEWKPDGNMQTAHLGIDDDGVVLYLTHHPTCYRSGTYRLLIEVCGGHNHHLWGCFDDQDQPLRYFHREANAKSEAEAIAQVLYRDRMSQRPTPAWANANQ